MFGLLTLVDFNQCFAVLVKKFIGMISSSLITSQIPQSEGSVSFVDLCCHCQSQNYGEGIHPAGCILRLVLIYDYCCDLQMTLKMTVLN